ncbi:hypothetical protein [Amycolatopsis sp. cg9]|uniref:hypothetical protein n=1 Tax=Amycolatopsis sp. cg9 TaxID=3238801 RepID=UPI003524A6FB
MDSIVAATAVLTISDAICSKAGIKRGTPPPELSARAPVYVPSAAGLEPLLHAVSFSNEELSSTLQNSDLIASLQRFSVRAGFHDLNLGIDTDNTFVITPIVETDDELIIANPGELAASLRHHLIKSAIEHGCLEVLRDAFHSEVVAQVDSLFKLMGTTRIATDEQEEGFIRRRYKLLEDKYVDVAIVIDNLGEYDVADPFGRWRTDDLSVRVQDSIDPARNPTEDDHKTLRIVILEGIGRHVFFGYEKPRLPGPFTTLSLDELQVMAELDGSDPLFLWKFAQADSDLHDRTTVQSFSTLDNYAIYRDANHSYYVGDDRPPTFFSIVNGSGTALRVEAQKRIDSHEVLGPDGQRYIEVISLWGTDVAPIYFVHPRHRRRGLFLELANSEVWIAGNNHYSGVVEDFFESLITALSFWLWQMFESKSVAFIDSVGENRQIFIMIEIDDPEKLGQVLAGESDGTSEDRSWIRVVDAQEGKVKLEILSDLFRVDSSDTNSEKFLVKALLDGLKLHVVDGDPTDFVNRLCSPPQKKMMRTVPLNDVRRYPSESFPPRLVQEYDTSVAMDELAHWLSEQQYDIGPIASEKRVETLGKVVEFYFGKVVALTAELSGREALQKLLSFHESLINQSAAVTADLPYQIACFGESSIKSEELAKRRNKLTESTIAIRFLIEYVAATQPKGNLDLTLSRFDQLMAISAELIARASLSDAIYHGFAENDLSILPSGRLGVSRGDRFEAGTTALSKAMAEAARRIAISPPGTVGTRTPSTDSLDAIDTAMRAEFGFTHSDISDVFDELINISIDAGVGTATSLPMEEVIELMNERLDWNRSKSIHFFGQLGLKARKKFLSVGSDAWPWRYNREWSYLRRPFILFNRDDGSHDLYWGARHLIDSAEYWTGLIRTGRVRAKSKEMKILMGSIRQGQNQQFETEVSVAFENSGCTPVRRGVTKVGSKRITSKSGEDLGDIDVLAFDKKKRIIFAVEAKDFEIARNATELANEADDLVRGEKSALKKHQRRSAWLQEHVSLVLSTFGLAGTGWKIVPLIVTSRDLITPRVLETPVPIVNFDSLEAWIRNFKPERRKVKR